MKTFKINARVLWINAALLLIPIALVAVLYPILPVLHVPRLGLNGSYLKTVDKHVYYLLAIIPIVIYHRLK
jgi:hypothetical protein